MIEAALFACAIYLVWGLNMKKLLQTMILIAFGGRLVYVMSLFSFPTCPTTWDLPVVAPTDARIKSLIFISQLDPSHCPPSRVPCASSEQRPDI